MAEPFEQRVERIVRHVLDTRVDLLAIMMAELGLPEEVARRRLTALVHALRYPRIEETIFEGGRRMATAVEEGDPPVIRLNEELLQRVGDDEVLTALARPIADITELARFTPLQAKRFAARGQAAIGRLQSLDVPVVAAVNGFALGGGTEMALACDFVYASEKARFGLPEINLGLIPGFGGTQRLPRLVGPNAARELIFTGRMIDAAEAARLGIVNRVCAPERLMEEVMETARTMAAKGRVALRAAKHAIRRGLDVDLAAGCAIEVDAFALCLASPDAKEGTGAFLEKRAAKFEGGLED